MHASETVPRVFRQNYERYMHELKALCAIDSLSLLQLPFRRIKNDNTIYLKGTNMAVFYAIMICQHSRECLLLLNTVCDSGNGDFDNGCDFPENGIRKME